MGITKGGYPGGADYTDDDGNTFLGVVPIISHRQAVRRGLVEGETMVLISGHQPAATTSFTTVYPAGTPQLIEGVGAAALVAVASSDANDAAAGTGARTCLLEGLSSTGAEQSETITLNGQTKVASANTYTAVHKLTVKTVGSGYENAGILSVGLNADTFTAGVPTTLILCMEATWNVSRTAFYRIPAGKVGYMDTCVLSSDAGKLATGRMLIRDSSSDPWLVWIEVNESQDAPEYTMEGMPAFVAGSEIRLDAKVSATTGAVTYKCVIFLADA